MADKKYSNPCSRCGKERVFVKTWKEKIGYSTITTTETACPDPECQKIVEKANKTQKAKYDASQLRRQQSFTHHKKSKKGL
ncbi:hypothetical protein HZA76_02530 [Candidatus Roizmanbacteria bacterium]|nr:hypothetical protein [Candidatus Roizmanbacteria bacterium]